MSTTEAAAPIRTVPLLDAAGQSADFVIGPLLPGPSGGHAHRHAFYTVLWVEQATGAHEIDFQLYPLAPHVLHFVGPDQVHRLVTDPDRALRGRVLRFTPAFLVRHGLGPDWLLELELFFNCDEAPPLPVPAAAVPQVRELVRRLQAEYAAGPEAPLHAESLAAWLRLLLIEARRLKVRTGAAPAPRPTTAADVMRRFKRYVEQHYRRTHRVADYARLLALTPNYLNEVVKQATGQSAKQVILGRALLEARRLASHSDLRLKQIAWELGFPDATHFAKLFRKHGGEAFTDFKARVRE